MLKRPVLTNKNPRPSCVRGRSPTTWLLGSPIPDVKDPIPSVSRRFCRTRDPYPSTPSSHSRDTTHLHHSYIVPESLPFYITDDRGLCPTWNRHWGHSSTVVCPRRTQYLIPRPVSHPKKRPCHVSTPTFRRGFWFESRTPLMSQEVIVSDVHKRYNRPDDPRRTDGWKREDPFHGRKRLNLDRPLFYTVSVRQRKRRSLGGISRGRRYVK